MSTQQTSAGTGPDLQLEIAHLLLIDVVGYSKLLVNEQIELLQALPAVTESLLQIGIYTVAEQNATIAQQ